MGINKAWDIFSVSVFCRENRYFSRFLLYSLCPKTMEIIVNSNHCLCSGNLVSFKLFT